MSVPSRQQTATTSLSQFFYVDSLTLIALIRTASGKGGGRNTETLATTRAWHERLQTLNLVFKVVIGEDEDYNWWYCGGPFRFEDTHDRAADHVYSQNHPGNCGTCSVGQVIRVTLSKTYMWSGWRLAVWSQPFHGAVALPALGLSHWKRTLLPHFQACSFDKRVDGPNSSGKGAKHWWRTCWGA